MKILLVKPKWWTFSGGQRFYELSRVAPLSLGILAALSGGHEVRIIDHDLEPIPYQEHFDLVGISSTTFTSLQAYRIAQRFRQRGTLVVMGGIHPTLLPEECLNHADAVVIGEGEYVWPQVLADASAGRLKRIYQAQKLTEMKDVPHPRRDLFATGYHTAAVQATRGCMYACKFCYLPETGWRKFRPRPIQMVIDEIKQIKQRLLFIVDDNIFCDRDYARELFQRMIPLRKWWWIQAPTVIAKDIELVRLMARAGCHTVAMGFQTVNEQSLKSARVFQNRVKEYRHVVRTMHREGIFVAGFFIFGFDHDDPSVFKRTVKMIMELGMEEVLLYILTPYPGTKFFEEFDKQGRLLHHDYSRYAWYNVAFRPRLMSPRQLAEGVRWAYKRLNRYHFFSNLRRFVRFLPLTWRAPALVAMLLRGGTRFHHPERLPLL